MKAAIYTPYLDTLGGGERYMLSAAKVIADNGCSVYLESKDDEVLKKASARFGLNLSQIRIADSINRGDGYDLCLWLSDGSIPALRARKNILHFQRPFYKVQGRSLLNRAKFFRIKDVIVNSKFTKSWVDCEYPVNSKIVYPPVDINLFKFHKKEKLILYVGRFSQLEQSKRQDVLIKAFKKFYRSGNRDFRLVLAGGSEVGRTEFVDQLYNEAKSYPIEIIENPQLKKLKELFGKALFFWSAAGFGVDENKAPEKVEHFGITVVESMAAGCVPIVYNAGGHKEIINHGVNGVLWESEDSLVEVTDKLCKNAKMIIDISKQATIDCQKYSYDQFAKSLQSLL